MTVGQRLKEIRIVRNLTQQEAANQYGCSRQYLNGVENDKINVGVRAIRKFAKFYNINVEILACLLVKGE